MQGGLGGEPGNEAHGGYTYCGAATLALLDRMPALNVPALAAWASQRQNAFCGGFDGRTNKLADGCYSFWQGALFPLLATYAGSSLRPALHLVFAPDESAERGAVSCTVPDLPEWLTSTEDHAITRDEDAAISTQAHDDSHVRLSCVRSCARTARPRTMSSLNSSTAEQRCAHTLPYPNRGAMIAGTLVGEQRGRRFQSFKSSRAAVYCAAW